MTVSCVRLYANPQVLESQMPSFLLQPLVENAVTHGIRYNTEHCIVEVSCELAGERLLLRVTDNGLGPGGNTFGVGGSVNRRKFVSSLSAACSLATVQGRFGAVEQRTPVQQRVHSQLELVVDAGLTVGAVMLAAQYGEVIAYEAVGYADAATKKRMRTDAIFDIRSISKIVTDFAILTLVDQGRIRLDQSLTEILPEFKKVMVRGEDHPPSSPITIRQIMMHSSGISNDLQPEIADITRTFDHTLADYTAFTVQRLLDFTPGTKWSCSGSGVATLGRVIEVVSDMPFDDFMHQRVFGPLEMQDSSFFTDRSKVARIPTMYNLENGQLVKDRMDSTRPGRKYPAPEFGMFSTAEDLRHFCQMMLDRGLWKGHRLLSESLYAEMTRPQMKTMLPKYMAGLGYAIYMGQDAEMSYAVTSGSFGVNGASGGLIWMDPASSSYASISAITFWATSGKETW